jgi:gamma-glutamyltranspeptidase/glutathione hydrolase/leukotriene-C4 hydrolase
LCLPSPNILFLLQLIRNLTSLDYAISIRDLIDDQLTNNTYEYYGAEYYQPEDHGTAHMSIIGPDGDAIAITSTVNLFYGAYIRSPRTGIIYNDEMDDFSYPNITNAFGVPPSPNNFVIPHKRPLSSMVPSIFVNNTDGKVRLVIGGAGGTKITTQSAIVRKLPNFYEDMRRIFIILGLFSDCNPKFVVWRDNYGRSGRSKIPSPTVPDGSGYRRRI